MEGDTPASGQERGLRLLSLDGGGIRGLSELIVVEEIMERIRNVKGLPETPLPSEYFDLIGGTSTGGLIAILFGRLNMSAADAVAAYEKLAGEVFSKRQAFWKDGTFSAKNLERAIQNVIKEKLGDDKVDAKLFEKSEASVAKCKAFVCAVPATDITTPVGPSLFRTYEVAANNEYRNTTIWEAARATSAAPTFFKRIKIGPPASAVGYLDAGLRYNNPVKQVVAEAGRVFGSTRTIDCIVSIGTGQPGSVGLGKPDTFERILPKKLIKALSKIATDAGVTAEEMEVTWSKVPGVYFRLDVDRGLRDVSLDEWTKLGDVRGLTNGYLKGQRVTAMVDKLVGILVSGQRDPLIVSQVVRIIEPITRQKYVFQLEFSQSNHFIRRSTLASTILGQLNGPKPRRCVLYGMAGIGKTALSLDIAEQFRDRIHVLWVNCSDTATMRANFRDIGAALSHTSTALSEIEVRRLLTDRDDWCLIFDNIDEDTTFECFRNELLPSGYNGRVLVTGRFVSLTTWSSPIRVPLLSVDEGVKLLTALCPSAQDSPNDSKILVQELGELPLAIELAAVYMTHSTTSVQEYTRRFRSIQKRTSLLREKPASGYSKQLKHTWTLSFSHITDDGRLLFNLLALLRPGGIEERFLEQGAMSDPPVPLSPTSKITGFERGVGLPIKYVDVLGNEERFRDAVMNLLRYALIQRHDNQKLFIHPVLRLLSSEQMKPALQQEIAEVSLYLVTNNMASFSDVDFVTNSQYLHYAKMGVLNPYLNLQIPQNASDEANAKIYFYLGRAYWLMREYEAAIEYYEKAKGFSETAFGTQHRWTLWIYNNLGLIAYETREIDRARDYFEKAWSGMNLAFGPDDPDTIAACGNLETVAQSKEFGAASDRNGKMNQIQTTLMPVDNTISASEAFSNFIVHAPHLAKEKLGRQEPMPVHTEPDFGKPSRAYSCLQCMNFTQDGTYKFLSSMYTPYFPPRDEIMHLSNIHLLAASYILQCDLTMAYEVYCRAESTQMKSSGLRQGHVEGRNSLLLNRELLSKLVRDTRMSRQETARLSWAETSSRNQISKFEVPPRNGEAAVLYETLYLCELQRPFRTESGRQNGHTVPHFDMSYHGYKEAALSIRSTVRYSDRVQLYSDIWECSSFDRYALEHGTLHVRGVDNIMTIYASFYLVHTILAFVLTGEAEKALALYKDIYREICSRTEAVGIFPILID